MNLARYNNLDLPEHPSDTPVAWFKSDLYDLAHTDQGSVIRVVFADGLPDKPLEEALTDADTAFTHVAENCGALVVKHEWGLYKKIARPSEEDLRIYRDYAQPASIPSSHMLVAEVDVIREVRPPSWEKQQEIAAAIKTHEKSNLPYLWDDARTSQFVDGVGPDDENVLTFCIDIDPLMRPGKGPRSLRAAFRRFAQT